jgi:hypothetical protein
MSDKRSFILAHPEARRRAMACVADAPDGYCVDVRPPTKRRIQEERYHAMIGDIAKQMEHIGRKWDADDMKRLLIDEFADQMRASGTPLHHDGRVVPSLDGRRIVQLGIQSRDFYVKEASQFIEFLFALGAERGIRWTDPKLYRAEVPA